MSFVNGGMIDHASRVPVPIAMSTGEAEYLGAGNACMSAAHLKMLLYDLHHLGTRQHTDENHEQIPSALVRLDSEAAMAWYLLAASQDDSDASFMMGTMYLMNGQIFAPGGLIMEEQMKNMWR